MFVTGNRLVYHALHTVMIRQARGPHRVRLQQNLENIAPKTYWKKQVENVDKRYQLGNTDNRESDQPGLLTYDVIRKARSEQNLKNPTSTCAMTDLFIKYHLQQEE